MDIKIKQEIADASDKQENVEPKEQQSGDKQEELEIVESSEEPKDQQSDDKQEELEIIESSEEPKDEVQILEPIADKNNDDEDEIQILEHIPGSDKKEVENKNETVKEVSLNE